MKMKLIPTLLAFIVLILLFACKEGNRDFDRSQFEKAAVVGSYSLSKDRENLHVKTSAGVNASVMLLSKLSVFIEFEDEKIQRKICDANWIFSSEIRQEKEKDLLFVEIAGTRNTSHGEWVNETKIYVYSLSKRKLVGVVRT